MYDESDQGELRRENLFCLHRLESSSLISTLFVGDREMERGEAAMPNGKGKVAAKAGVQDRNAFQILKFSVTQAQRLDRWVGT